MSINKIKIYINLAGMKHLATCNVNEFYFKGNYINDISIKTISLI